jgi:hypothetical protein
MISKFQISKIRGTLLLAINAIKNPRKIFKYIRNPSSAVEILIEPFIDVKLRKLSSKEIIKQNFSALAALGRIAGIKSKPISQAEFLLSNFFLASKSSDNAFKLKILLDKFGSDKASTHDYYLIYQLIFDELNMRETEPKKILEIGIGTNMLDIPSNMGRAGKPGASLRAFSSYLPSFTIHGADIDKRILFKEEMIETFWVDQLSYEALNDIFIDNKNYDLIIDDGLHTSEANLMTLSITLQAVKIGGYIVVEDIANDANTVNYWNIVTSLISPSFRCKLVSTSAALLFIAKRIN